jgi:hypothetical protein
MTGHDIFVSILQKHLIARKVAEEIADEFHTAMKNEFHRKLQERVCVIPLPIGEENGRVFYSRDKAGNPVFEKYVIGKGETNNGNCDSR